LRLAPRTCVSEPPPPAGKVGRKVEAEGYVVVVEDDGHVVVELVEDSRVGRRGRRGRDRVVLVNVERARDEVGLWLC